MYYIQRTDQQTRQLETVDEFTTKKEANNMRYEYVMSDRFANYRISTKPCKDWKEEKNLKKMEKICEYL